MPTGFLRLRQLPAVNNPTFLRLRHSLRQVLMDLLFSVEFYFLFIFTQFPLLLGTIRDLILEPLSGTVGAPHRKPSWAWLARYYEPV